MATPFFDAAFYLAQNEDLQAAFGTDAAAAEAHYFNVGAAEALAGATSRQPAPWFDAAYYLAQNSDLETAGITNGDLFLHFVNNGMREGRAPMNGVNLDVQAYAAANEDLATFFGVTDLENITPEQAQALAGHFYERGYLESREGAPEVPGIDGGDTSTLTETLEALQAEQKALADKLAEIAVAENAVSDPVLEGDDLDAFIAAYTSEDAVALAEGLDQDIEDAQADVDAANGALLNARAKTIEDTNANGAAVAAAGLTGITADTIATDANIAKAVTEAKAAVKADKALYNADGDVVVDAEGTPDAGVEEIDEGVYGVTTSAPVEAGTYYIDVAGELTEVTVSGEAGSLTVTPEDIDGNTLSVSVANAFELKDDEDADVDFDAYVAVETLTAAKLQTLATQAASTLAAHESNKGDYVDLLASLKDSLVAYVAAGGQATAAFTAGASVAQQIDAINLILANTDEDAQDDAAEAMYNALKVDDAVTFAPVDADAPTAGEKAVSAAVDVLQERATLEANAEATEDAFEATATGAVLVAAEALQADRDTLKTNVDDAVSDKAALESLQTELATLLAEHDEIVANIEELEAAIADAGIEHLITLDSDSSGNLLEADLFILAADGGDILTLTIGRFEDIDQLFLGTAIEKFEVIGDTVDVSKGGVGDVSVLEVFAQDTSDGVVLFVEAAAFGGTATGNADIVQVTLTGVTAAELSFNDGFVTFA